MPRRISTRCICKHLSYTFDEAAEAVGVCTETVRRWSKQGLPVLRDQRPALVLGADLRAFIENRNEDCRVKLAHGEFYCMKCKRPTKALGAMADYDPQTSESGVLIALCDVCEIICHRFVKQSQLSELEEILEIQIKGESAA